MTTGLSPLDGRYASKLKDVAAIFSEQGLLRTRVFVEGTYFCALVEIIPELQRALGLSSASDPNAKAKELELFFMDRLKSGVRQMWQGFTDADARSIQEIEAVTKHDVKAVEYFVKSRLLKLFQEMGVSEDNAERATEFVHFGLTSQDINNTSIPLMVSTAIEQCYIPTIVECVLKPLRAKARAWMNIPMLARTHGQPATPTRLGKELCVWIERVEAQLELLLGLKIDVKFGGAVGLFNAHYVAYPDIDWLGFADEFVQTTLLEYLNSPNSANSGNSGNSGNSPNLNAPALRRSRFTTQIAHYDMMGAVFDCMKRINTILIDLSRDFWQYISYQYFAQAVVSTEVGSSTMPNKVNPIAFENAEGNFGVANALFEHLSAKLPISRLQRDLSDSTVLRNIGVPFGHSVLAFKSLGQGLARVSVNEAMIAKDLGEHWAVVAEAVQTVLRREGFPKPYEKLKAFTRGEHITQEGMRGFIESLEVEQRVKEELLSISPSTFIGRAPELEKGRWE